MYVHVHCNMHMYAVHLLCIQSRVTSYAYSLLMRANKLKTAAVQGSLAVWPHHNSFCHVTRHSLVYTCTCTCTCTYMAVRSQGVVVH